MHTPVFLKEVVEAFEPIKGKRIIDATFGEGGHSRALLEKGAKVLGIDIDPEQVRRGKKNFRSWIEKGKLILVQGNFSNIERIAKKTGFVGADGVIFDLGLSMVQLYGQRGFSYKRLEEPLDLRWNKRFKNTAAELLNYLPFEELYEVIASYSEEPFSREIVEEIVDKRKRKKFRKVKDLVEVVEKVVGKKRAEKSLRRLFQALRMVVNNETFNLEKGLEGAIKVVKREGKIVVISFHSIEDRIVKRFIKEKELKLEKKLGISKRRKKSFERTARLRVIKV